MDLIRPGEPAGTSQHANAPLPLTHEALANHNARLRADGRDRLDATASTVTAGRPQRPRLSIVSPAERRRRESDTSFHASSPGSFSARSFLSWLSPTLSTIEADFPLHIEEAADKLGLCEDSSFFTDRGDMPAETPLSDLGHAKMFLLGLYATAQDEDRWDNLVEFTATLQSIRPDPFGVTELARAVLHRAHKPDSLDTLILLQGLSMLPEESHAMLAEHGLALFSVLNPRDTAPLLEALRTHVLAEEIPLFCADMLQYALVPNERSHHSSVPLHKIDDYLEQARLSLTAPDDERSVRGTFDNLDVLRNLVRLGPQGRAAARDAAETLQPLMNACVLPRAMAHIFVRSLDAAAHWVQAARDVCYTVQNRADLCLDLESMDASTRDKLVLTLFQQGVFESLLSRHRRTQSAHRTRRRSPFRATQRSHRAAALSARHHRSSVAQPHPQASAQRAP